MESQKDSYMYNCKPSLKRNRKMEEGISKQIRMRMFQN